MPRRAMAAHRWPACRVRFSSARHKCRSSTARPTTCPSARTPTARPWSRSTGISIRHSALGPNNVIGTCGGRDALVKAYQAMLSLGHGREGDVIAVSRVPWISYNWGPYGIGANVLWSPGDPANGWAYSEEGIRASVEFAAKSGRKVAGLIITNPDNPTGLTVAPERQVALARAALEAGIPFVLFDWMYHYVTDELPMDLNTFLKQFSPDERKHLMFLDGITKSLGGSNIRNCHLIASEEVIKFTVARASHAVMPTFYSLAVAMAAYEMGYAGGHAGYCRADQCQPQGAEIAAGLAAACNTSLARATTPSSTSATSSRPRAGRIANRWACTWPRTSAWPSCPVPSSHPFGGDWIRFSYATPVERTRGAFQRLVEGLNSSKS